MNKRSFGRDGVEISEVGLGCWQLGGNWSHVEDETAKAILKASLDSGITFLDTADVYGAGRSETIIGKFLKEVGRDDIFVATKVGRLDLYPDKYTEEAVQSHIEDSLRRLQVDSLDLVQTHCVPGEIMESGEIYQWLGNLRQAGKIKRIAASIETVEEALMLIDSVPELYSLQVIFNIFRQKPIHELFEKAKEKQVGIIARVPLASGVLSGKYTKDTTFGKGDHRNFNKDGKFFNVGETFAGVPFEKGIEFVQKIEALRPENMTLAQMALRWILDFDAVSVVIPGATKPEQAVSNAAVSDLPSLSSEIHQSLSDLYQNEIHEEVRGVY